MTKLPARYAAGDVTYQPSTKGRGFDIITPDGATTWALTEESARSTVKMFTEGLIRKDHTASEWRYIATGR